MAGEDMIMARQGELKRLHVIQKVLEGIIRQVEAAEILLLSGRQSNLTNEKKTDIFKKFYS